MFDFIRTHQRLMQFLLLLLVIPPLVLFMGVEGMSTRNTDNAVATVAGQQISELEFDAALRRQLEPQMMQVPQARQYVLDQLITERVVKAEIDRKHLTVPEQKLQEAVLGTPGLIDAEGKFDRQKYRDMLMQNGMTERGYEARLRQDMIQQQLGVAVQSSSFIPKTLAAHISDLATQERHVQELVFKPADFASKVNVSDDMLKAYYDAHPREFEIPEQATAEYVVLDLDTVASQISVTDDDIKSFYTQNQKQFTVDEQRRASHILIAAGKDAPDAQKAAAKAKAEALLAQVKKNPGDFAKVARENSNDPGSAERGGDLDFFSRGMMVKPFEDAAYQLKEGEISGLVQSDFGYHIIRLTGIKPAVVKPIEAVKDEIASQIKKQRAQKEFSEMAETFTNTVYEQSDSLKPVADKLKLKLQTASGLTREPSESSSPEAPHNNPKFLKALFTEDSIKNKRNTEAVETATSTLIAGRIIEYRPVTKRPLAEVKDAVREKVIQQEAVAMAKKAGEARLAAVRTQDNAAGFSEVKTVSREKPQGVEPQALSAVMKADVSKLPGYIGTDLKDKGYAVYRIVKVSQPQAMDAERRKVEEQQFASMLGQQELTAYVEVLKKKAKTKILKPQVGTAPSTDAAVQK